MYQAAECEADGDEDEDLVGAVVQFSAGHKDYAFRRARIIRVISRAKPRAGGAFAENKEISVHQNDTDATTRVQVLLLPKFEEDASHLESRGTRVTVEVALSEVRFLDGRDGFLPAEKVATIAETNARAPGPDKATEEFHPESRTGAKVQAATKPPPEQRKKKAKLVPPQPKYLLTEALRAELQDTIAATLRGENEDLFRLTPNVLEGLLLARHPKLASVAKSAVESHAAAHGILKDRSTAPAGDLDEAGATTTSATEKAGKKTKPKKTKRGRKEQESASTHWLVTFFHLVELEEQAQRSSEKRDGGDGTTKPENHQAIVDSTTSMKRNFYYHEKRNIFGFAQGGALPPEEEFLDPVAPELPTHETTSTSDREEDAVDGTTDASNEADEHVQDTAEDTAEQTDNTSLVVGETRPSRTSPHNVARREVVDVRDQTKGEPVPVTGGQEQISLVSTSAAALSFTRTSKTASTPSSSQAADATLSRHLARPTGDLSSETDSYSGSKVTTTERDRDEDKTTRTSTGTDAWRSSEWEQSGDGSYSTSWTSWERKKGKHDTADDERSIQSKTYSASSYATGATGSIPRTRNYVQGTQFFICPAELYFTQDTIKNTFRSRNPGESSITIRHTLDQMLNHELRKREIEIMNVVKHGDYYYSICNRRLATYMLLYLCGRCKRIKVELVDKSHRRVNWDERFTTDCNGQYIRVRETREIISRTREETTFKHPQISKPWR